MLLGVIVIVTHYDPNPFQGRDVIKCKNTDNISGSGA